MNLIKVTQVLLLFLLLSSSTLYAQNQRTDSASALRRTVQAKDEKGGFKALLEKSSALSKDGKFFEAVKLLQDIIRMAGEAGDKEMVATSYVQLGVIYARQANYPVALENFLSALKINEALADTNRIVHNLVNISSIQADQKDRDAALKTVRRAFLMAKKAGDSRQMTICLINLANFHILSDKKTSFKYFQKALTVVGDNVPYRIVILTQMGSLYTDRREFDKALQTLEEALKLAQETESKRSYGKIWSKMGLLFSAQKQYSQAIAYAQKALRQGEEINDLELKKDSYRYLSEAYAATGAFREAYSNQVKFKSLSDSIFNDRNVRKVAFMESSYLYDKEKQAYEKEKTAQKMKIQDQKQIILSLVFLSILALLLTFTIYWTNRLKKRVLNLEIENKNQELEINHKAMTAATLKLMENSERDTYSIKMLENIKKNTVGEGQNDIRTLITEYKLKSYNSNWNEFEILFEKTNSSFYEKLNECYPTLTPNERKLCVFLKLNMSNNHISQVTFQSEEALKKSRLRLRKKLEIDRDTNLAAFIQRL